MIKRDKRQAADSNPLRNGQIQAEQRKRELKGTAALEFEALPVREKIGELAYLFGELFAGFDRDPLPRIKSFILSLSERVRQSLLRAAFEAAKENWPLDSATAVKEYILSCQPLVRERIVEGSAMAIEEL